MPCELPKILALGTALAELRGNPKIPSRLIFLATLHPPAGTFWGLCRLLTGVKDFDEMLRLSAEGDNSKVPQQFPPLCQTLTS
jgi:hypothetical protein